MDVTKPIDKARAHQQWHHFVDVLRELGDELEFIEAAPGCPDMTFSGDVGLVSAGRFIASRFRATVRQREVEHYVRWFGERGFRIVEPPPGVYLEGLGDLVFHEHRAILGHGIRSSPEAVDFVRELIPELQILCSVRIVDDRYFHLAMALGFIDADTVLYYPAAFDDESVARLRAAVRDPIAVGDVDANEYFACNNLVIGKTVILDDCTPELEAALAERGYGVRRTPMSEFKLSGGSLRCLVLTFL
jgi:N-dimethylarginine dimethylaminohydrolase